MPAARTMRRRTRKGKRKRRRRTNTTGPEQSTRLLTERKEGNHAARNHTQCGAEPCGARRRRSDSWSSWRPSDNGGGGFRRWRKLRRKTSRPRRKRSKCENAQYLRIRCVGPGDRACAECAAAPFTWTALPPVLYRGRWSADGAGPRGRAAPRRTPPCRTRWRACGGRCARGGAAPSRRPWPGGGTGAAATRRRRGVRRLKNGLARGNPRRRGGWWGWGLEALPSRVSTAELDA